MDSVPGSAFAAESGDSGEVEGRQRLKAAEGKAMGVVGCARHFNEMVSQNLSSPIIRPK